MSRKEAYTDMVMLESLKSLLEKKPPEKISVTELCELADINRATFYARYYSLDQYYAKIAEDYVHSVMDKASLEIQSVGVTHETIKNTVRESLLVFKNSPSLYPLIRYVDNVRIHKHIYSKAISSQDDSPQLRFAFDFLMSGAGGICTQWKDDGFKIPVETMAENLTITIEAIFRDVVPRLIATKR